MKLTDDLLSQFAKITKDDPKDKKETIVYGTVVVQNGNKYVRMDGSDILTPVAATADTIDGERVIVMIKNHTATITGNITSPAARVGDIQAALDGIDKVGTVEEKIDIMQGIVSTLNIDMRNIRGTVSQLSETSTRQTEILQALTEQIGLMNKEITSLKNLIESNHPSNSN